MQEGTKRHGVILRELNLDSGDFLRAHEKGKHAVTLSGPDEAGASKQLLCKRQAVCH